MAIAADVSVDHVRLDPLREEIRDRWLVAGLAALTLFGAWLRYPGLSKGSLYRDDAWVALTHRVPIAEAWKMVGTAPGFTMFERFWTGLTAPSTWWAQLPILMVSVLAIPLIVLVSRWWGLARWSSLLAGGLIAVSRVDVTYATHLKPYAHDVVAATVVLFATEWWRRGRSPWLFTFVAALSIATSFTIAPLVVGCALVIAVQSASTKRLGNVILPLGALAAASGAIFWAVHQEISPELRSSWRANFFDYHSADAFQRSFTHIFSGLIWGFGDTAPAMHAPGYAKLFIVAVVVFAVIAMTRIKITIVPVAAILGAVGFAAARQIALGTGRTDAYLYPAIAILVCFGAQIAVEWVSSRQRIVGTVVLSVIVIFFAVSALDRATHRPTYPGGDISPVASAAHATLAQKGGVIIEGSARWPWTYYEVHHVRLVFSSRYNTGFAPLSDDPNVSIMPGTIIEGSYDPYLAVRKVSKHAHVLYVRTDDWPSLGDPLHLALRAACFHETRSAHTPGFELMWLTKGTCPPPPKLPRSVQSATPTAASSTPRH